MTTTDALRTAREAACEDYRSKYARYSYRNPLSVQRYVDGHWFLYMPECSDQTERPQPAAPDQPQASAPPAPLPLPQPTWMTTPVRDRATQKVTAWLAANGSALSPYLLNGVILAVFAALGETDAMVERALEAFDDHYEAEIQIGASHYTDNKPQAMRAAILAALGGV